MKKGDFVKIEFLGRVVGTNEIFDLTSEETARKEGIHNPNARYGPVLVILGAGMVIPGVEKELETMKIGEEREFNVKPEQAFGSRNPKLIRIISMSKFIDQKINPVPGIFVNIDGMHAKVQSVSGGRIRVDFNHPLAGKELHYKVKVLVEIKTPLERARAITEYYNIKSSVFLKDSKLEINTEKPLDERVRRVLENTIKEWIRGIREIKFPQEKPNSAKNGQKT